MKTQLAAGCLFLLCGCAIFESGTPEHPRVVQSCIDDAISTYKNKYITDKHLEPREYKVRYQNTAKQELGLRTNVNSIDSFDIGTLVLGEENRLTFIPAGEENLNIKRQPLNGQSLQPEDFKMLYLEKKELIETLVANAKVKKPVEINFGKNFKGECLRPRENLVDFAYRDMTIRINSCSPNFFAALQNYLLYKGVVVE